ncbi:MAG TPA: carbohydrate-binding protein, partial [Cellvibrio sp.]
MAGNIKATRLGDILLEKGLLREDQLQLAIAEQKRRRATLDPSDKRMMDATSIGEILIEMGYITRQQLKRGLNWQMYLRKMTLVMSLVAPLMSAAGGAVAQTTTPTTNSTNSSNTTTTSLMIQAEDFSAMKGIKVEATTDEGGGSNVGAIDAGDWLAYANQEINIAAATTFKVTYRVSSLYGGGSFSLHELDTGVEYDRVDVPKTGNFQKWVDVERTVTLPAGRHTLGLTALVKGFNINWFKLEPIVSNPPQSATVSSASSSQPSSVAVSSAPASSTPAVTSSSAPSSVAVSSSSQPSSVAVSSSSPASSAPVSSASSSLAATGNTPTLSLRIEAE